jgi:hypothetical protein
MTAPRHLRPAPPEGEEALLPELPEPSREELALFERRRGPGPTQAEREVLWLQVQRRLARTASRRGRRRFALAAGAAGLVAAAAAVVVVLGRPPPAGPAVERAAARLADDEGTGPIDPATEAALRKAEAESQAALRTLEAEVRERAAASGQAQAQGLDRALAPARKGFDAARALARDDVPGRLRLLEQEARYLHSLARALREEEEATP